MYKHEWMIIMTLKNNIVLSQSLLLSAGWNFHILGGVFFFPGLESVDGRNPAPVDK